MFNIKDEDSKRWGSNVYSLKACVYHLHFHFAQVHAYSSKMVKAYGDSTVFSDMHKDFLTHGYSGRHTERNRGI